MKNETQSGFLPSTEFSSNVASLRVDADFVLLFVMANHKRVAQTAAAGLLLVVPPRDLAGFRVVRLECERAGLLQRHLGLGQILFAIKREGRARYQKR